VTRGTRATPVADGVGVPQDTCMSVRRALVPFLVLAVVVVNPIAAQDRAPAGERISACALLSTELMLKVGGIHKTMVAHLKPEEEPVGAIGTACEYASVRLQVNPFGKGDRPRQPTGAGWQAVAGVGEAAFFRPLSGQYGELIVWTGAHHFTIQFGVPTGGTPESIRPNTITLANAIVAALR
jgi:hypothetical protein